MQRTELDQARDRLQQIRNDLDVEARAARRLTQGANLGGEPERYAKSLRAASRHLYQAISVLDRLLAGQI